MKRLHLALILSTALVCGACSQLPLMSVLKSKDAPSDAAKVAGPLQVKAEGSMKTLSDGQVAATKAADFLPNIKRLLNEQRGQSARAFIAKQPDVALEVLRDGITSFDQPELQQAVARAYDEQFGLSPTQGWRHVLTDRAGKPDRLAAYAHARTKLLDAIRSSSSIDKAVAESAREAQATREPMILLDQRNLSGIAWLVAEQPKRAAESLAEGAQLAATLDPYQEVQFHLLRSDALRRGGDMKSANDTWRLTIEKASVLAQRQPALFDPVFWDRASYWRPVGTPWPASALVALAPLSQLNVSPNATTIGEGEAEAIVWGAIGRALLDRADHQSALVAFKRAEAATSHEDLRGWLRLAQGESLACLDQTPAATAVFVSLVTSSDQRLAQAATAALGGTKLRQGDTATGFHLLARSIESPDSADWPARAKAEADLGLAYLMKNDEANGLKWLHSAQARFRTTGDVTSLSQSLWNEAAYLKQIKRASDESTVRTRLTTCESDSLLAQR